MKYAKTILFDDTETVATVLPLKMVPFWNPNDAPPFTYLVDDEVQRGWIKDGDSFIPPPPPTVDERIALYVQAVQKRLDAFAKTKGYDNILAACSYATSTNPQYQLEGQYAVEARDATWASFYAMTNPAKDDLELLPELVDVLDELPSLEWPND